MLRCGNIRRYLHEIAESPRAEKISFIPPFVILGAEIILLNHALTIGESHVIFLTLFLLLVSVIELFLVALEIHEHRKQSMFERILTIKLDDFIMETRRTNVKEIVSKFIERYPMYRTNRSEVYRLTCQIMQTHKDEKMEAEYSTKLRSFVRSAKETNATEIVSRFLKKYAQYERYRLEIYEKVCQMLEKKK